MEASSSSGGVLFPWEVRDLEFGQRPPTNWSLDSDSEDYEDTGDEVGEAAGENLTQFLMGLHYSGMLSAKSVCVACYYAARAGAKGPVDKFGFRPGAPSGHYSRHLDSVSGVRVDEEKKWRYSLDVPEHGKYDVTRTAHEVLVTVAHEALNEEVLNDPSIVEQVRLKTWPSLYHQNPIVRESSEPVLPLALYLDGVPTTKRDGCLGVWIYNLVTQRRHLLVVLRKSTMCRCGCRKWDSLHVVWAYLRWTCKAMARGLFPSSRHDNLEWKAADHER